MSYLSLAFFLALSNAQVAESFSCTRATLNFPQMFQGSSTSISPEDSTPRKPRSDAKQQSGSIDRASLTIPNALTAKNPPLPKERPRLRHDVSHT